MSLQLFRDYVGLSSRWCKAASCRPTGQQASRGWSAASQHKFKDHTLIKAALCCHLHIRSHLCEGVHKQQHKCPSMLQQSPVVIMGKKRVQGVSPGQSCAVLPPPPRTSFP